MDRWRSIDRREVEEHARLAAAALDQRSAVQRAYRLVQWRLRQTELQSQ